MSYFNNFILATRNNGKVCEFRELQQKFPLNYLSDVQSVRHTMPLMSLGEYEKKQSPLGEFQISDEPYNTFMQNAQAKALKISEQIRDALVLADDSGLCLPALNNQPGVHSARYAGERASDQQNIERLLQQLTLANLLGPQQAFFCACLALAFDGEIVACSSGFLPGTISTSPAGQQGFGYDPIFIPQSFTQTMAQIPLASKNLISHRTRAWQFLSIPVGQFS